MHVSELESASAGEGMAGSTISESSSWQAARPSHTVEQHLVCGTQSARQARLLGRDECQGRSHSAQQQRREQVVAVQRELGTVACTQHADICQHTTCSRTTQQAAHP